MADLAAWDIQPDESRLISAPDLPTPAADLARACAHDLLTARDATGHVDRHLTVALTAASPTFDLEHADSHVTQLTDHLDSLITNLKRLNPAIGAEIDLLSKAMRQVPAAKAPAVALPRTCAHLLITSRVAAAHIRRHLDNAMVANTAESVKFNTAHAFGHTQEAHEHLGKLADALKRYVPAVGKEIDLLDGAIWVAQPLPGEGGPEPA